jgi:hypothetical protein
VLYDLWYARDFSGLAETVNALPASDIRRSFVVGSVAAQQGSEAALRKSLEITTEEDSRRKVLTNAGWLLVHLRKYNEAADLLLAGARGANSETQTLNFAGSLKKAKLRDEIKIDDSSPSGAIQRLFSSMFTRTPDYERLRSLLSKNAMKATDPKKDKQDFRKQMFQLRAQLEKSGVPIEVLGDIIASNTRYSVEGNDALGYKVTVQPPGAPEQEAFVVREDGSYKVLEFARDQKPPEDLGWQALDMVKNNDLVGARKWLDWAREKIHMGGSDDPLSVQPFPYFWTKGQEGDAAAARTAALVLMPSKGLRGDDLRALLEAG